MGEQGQDGHGSHFPLIYGEKHSLIPRPWKYNTILGKGSQDQVPPQTRTSDILRHMVTVSAYNIQEDLCFWTRIHRGDYIGVWGKTLFQRDLMVNQMM